MIRTGYSYKQAYGHLKDVANRLLECDYPALPIADRNSTHAFVKWDKLCKKVNRNPVFGCELFVTTDMEDRAVGDWWSFYPVSDMQVLNNLIYLASGQDWKLTYDQALRYCEQYGIFAITGPNVQLEEITDRGIVFIGISPATPIATQRYAEWEGYNCVATSNNFYPQSDDADLWQIACGRNANMQTYPQHILTDEEWMANVHIEGKLSALKRRDHILEHCVAKLVPGEMFVPIKPKTLREMCIDGAAFKGIDLNLKVYKERLDRELALIADKKFEDYFYIVADLIRYAKENMLVGPARGSSCGSLVCYLIDITAVDPIPHGLIFERFIDINRMDYPDIDVDFSADKREMVFEYARQKYGRDHVARLGTVTMFKPKSALAAGKAAFDIPPWKINKVVDSIIQRSTGDSRALQTMGDTFAETPQGRELIEEFPGLAIVAKLEGHPQGHSQHAAGLLISKDPILKHVAVDANTQAAMIDKYDAEAMNLLKVDALGLTQLSVFERAMELIGITDRRFLEKLPLNDQKAFDVLNRGHFYGVFQFAGISLQSICKQITVSDFNDIVSITALARPGPMASGGTMSWVRRKTGKETITYPHESFEGDLRDTIGIVCYQEQVMNIGRNVGDLSWEDVTALRKAMSKSLGKEFFNQYGDRWKEGARRKGVYGEIADKVWDDLCAYGAWSFNKSHAVAYGLISYYCCWFKAYHPVEFAAATLDQEADPLRQVAILRELAEEGIDYIPVDIGSSGDKWSVIERDGQKVLLGPLSNVKGVGAAATDQILNAREGNGEIREGILNKFAPPKTAIDDLYPIKAAVKRNHPDLEAIGIVTKPTNIKDIQCKKGAENKQYLVFCILNKIAPKDENEVVNVAKRGYALKGPVQALNLFLKDDTDEIFAKVDRWKFPELGKPIVDRGKARKALYAIKGTCPADFRMIKVQRVKYLGDLDD